MTMTRLQEATQAYLVHLKTQGKSDRTLYTYGMDLNALVKFFGAEQELEKMTPLLIGKFLKSDTLINGSKNGRERSAISIQKNIRVMRQFLIWATHQGLINSVPLPKAVPLGRDTAVLSAPISPA